MSSQELITVAEKERNSGVVENDDLGSGAYADLIQNNLNAVSDPTPTDDSSVGYSVESKWYNSVNDVWYICSDASVGTAIWSQLTGQTEDVKNNEVMIWQGV